MPTEDVEGIQVRRHALGAPIEARLAKPQVGFRVIMQDRAALLDTEGF